MTPFLYEHREKWVLDPKIGCYIWIAATSGSKGKRPLVKRFGKLHYVARIVCEEIWGPPPEGHETSHSCHNGMCVNGAHIKWDTHNNNMLDSRWAGV